MRKLCLFSILVFASTGWSQESLPPSVAAGSFTVTQTPSFNGHRVTADLPATQHKRNVGGSDRAGLCVYTSAWHAALWQSVSELYGFRDWMTRRPGGSYPQKFEQTLTAYCTEKGIPLPNYVQHTGGDEDVLRLALKTGRMVCVTYCGVDGPGRYGSEVIAHMVNLAYLDDQHACIIDNNFPGSWLWMSRVDFLARWRGVKPDGSAFMARDDRGRGFPVGGGWAIVLLGSPPPPYPDRPGVQWRNAESVADAPPVVVGQCPNGVCPIPQAGMTGPAPFGNPPTDRHEWGRFPDGVYGWLLKSPPVEVAPLVGSATDFPRGGVDSARMVEERTYSYNGGKVSKEAFTAALSLSDDSARWHIAIVGDPAFARRVRDDLEALPAAVRSKLHVQNYAPTDWPSIQFKLSSGVTLRRPAVGRVGADVGSVAVEDYNAARLVDLLCREDGPTPKPVPLPMPPKPKEPTPPDLINPTPRPTPTPEPTPPAPKPAGAPLWFVALAAFVIAALIFRK